MRLLTLPYIVSNHRYLVGGTLQVNFPARFSIEVDGLYRRVGFQHQYVNEVPPSVGKLGVQRSTANSWEFPVLGKVALSGGPIRPFADAGASFRSITGGKSGIAHFVPELGHDFTAGFTFGGGVEFKLGRMRISPEFRYTHWGTENFSDPVNSLLHTNLNQGDFIVGITF
jgi:opacity protein-like surface antigen